MREPELVSYELSTLANKQGQVCDAGLVNGRRFRVGWAPKLCLLHVGESKGPGADAMRSKSKDKQILFGSRFVRGRTCSDFNLTIRNFCIGNGSDDKSYVLVSFNYLWLFNGRRIILRESSYREKVGGNH